MRVLILSLSLAALALPGAAQAQGPYRTGVSILIKHDKAGEPRVTIRSAVKAEQQESVSVDEACRAVKAMKGEFGLPIAVAVVSDQHLHGPAAKKLLDAILDHGGLTLNSVGGEMPKTEPGQIGEDEDILEFAARDPFRRYLNSLPNTDHGAAQLKDIARPWTVAKMLKHVREEKDPARRGSLLWILALSRDPRGAVAIADAAKNEGAQMLILQNTYAPMAIGGTEAQIIAVEAWWKKNEGVLRKKAKDLETKAQEKPDKNEGGKSNREQPASAPANGAEIDALRVRILAVERTTAADVRFLSFTCEAGNVGKAPLMFVGYRADAFDPPIAEPNISPIHVIEFLRDGQWQTHPQGWCGTGMGGISLPAGSTKKFAFAVPEDLAGKVVRVDIRWSNPQDFDTAKPESFQTAWSARFEIGSIDRAKK